MNELQATFDFTYFYWALIICLVIGLFSAICNKSVRKIMDETEESANGRTAH
ncbi:MAG: hypothetical protein K6T65_02210 [Peptococcaceae bacterium]|nr:hypothetical protein [Peptococcaceae bacterium]